MQVSQGQPARVLKMRELRKALPIARPFQPARFPDVANFAPESASVAGRAPAGLAVNDWDDIKRQTPVMPTLPAFGVGYDRANSTGPSLRVKLVLAGVVAVGAGDEQGDSVRIAGAYHGQCATLDGGMQVVEVTG